MGTGIIFNKKIKKNTCTTCKQKTTELNQLECNDCEAKFFFKQLAIWKAGETWQDRRSNYNRDKKINEKKKGK